MMASLIGGLFGRMFFLGVLSAFVMIACAVFQVFFLPKLKGRIGEAFINYLVKRRLNQSDYRLIPDVTLPTLDGTTQIDHVVVSRYGIFVIETKNYKGWIYGGQRDAKWTQVFYRNKNRFQNPLRQNYKHTKTLSDLTGIPHDYFKSIVVFVGDSTFKSALPDNVVHLRGFLRHIRSYQTPIIKDKQIPDITSVIQEWAGTVTNQQKRQHVKNLHRNRQSVQAVFSPPPARSVEKL